MESRTPAVRLASALIDFSAFAAKPAAGDGKAKYTIKELTVVDIHSGCHHHWIFKHPRSTSFLTGIAWLDLHNSRLIERYHGMNFRVGLTEYESLTDSLSYLCSGVNLLFAPNRAKANILEDLFHVKRVVFDLEALGCPAPPTFNLLSRSVASYDGVSLTTDHDLDDRLTERAEAANEEILTAPSCMYHQMRGSGFLCTQSRTLNRGLWCALNPSALDMNDPANREKTFDGWKLSAPSAKALADAGFVRIGITEDSTKCVYCGISPGQWKEGDDPDAEHGNKNPHCKLIRYRDQTRRREKEADCLAAGSDRSTHRRDCVCRPEKTTKKKKKLTASEFYRRYRKVPDITLRDVYVECSA